MNLPFTPLAEAEWAELDNLFADAEAEEEANYYAHQEHLASLEEQKAEIRAEYFLSGVKDPDAWASAHIRELESVDERTRKEEEAVIAYEKLEEEGLRPWWTSSRNDYYNV